MDLDTLASAGGTGRATFAPSEQPGSIASALESIRARILPCSFATSSISEFFEPSDVEVVVRGLAPEATVLRRVPDRTSCGTGNGFYFDDADSPRFATLCRATCEAIRATTGAEIEFSTSCNVTR